MAKTVGSPRPGTSDKGYPNRTFDIKDAQRVNPTSYPGDGKKQSGE